jgi:spore coat protein U-like protein
MPMSRRRTLALATLMAGAGAEPARAVTQQAFHVSADIVSGCVVATSGQGNWGNIDLGTVAGTLAGTVQADLLSGGASGIQLDCTPGMTVNITADTGLQPQAGTRRVAIAGDLTTPIPYQLYANGSATPWTTQSIPLVFPTGVSHQLLPVRAQATLSGFSKAGAYRDTVRITLAW